MYVISITQHFAKPARAEHQAAYFITKIYTYIYTKFCLTKIIIMSSSLEIAYFPLSIITYAAFVHFAKIYESHLSKSKPISLPVVEVIHTAFNSKPMGLRASFRSFDSAALVLRSMITHESIITLGNDASLFYSMLDDIERSLPLMNFDGLQVIVFEGLPQSGKSTIISDISQKYGFSIYYQPILLVHMRNIFYNISDLTGIALDFVALYASAWHISTSKSKKWLLEGYYHCFIAGNIARHEMQEESIRGLPKGLWEWPKDLLMPNMIGE